MPNIRIHDAPSPISIVPVGNDRDQAYAVVSNLAFDDKKSQIAGDMLLNQPVFGAFYGYAADIRTALPPVAEQPKPTQPVRKTFETIRIVEMAQLYACLRKQEMAHKNQELPFEAAYPERAQLLLELKRLNLGNYLRFLDVVVVRCPEIAEGELKAETIGGTVFLRTPASENCAEGQESSAFFAVLASAMREIKR